MTAISTTRIEPATPEPTPQPGGSMPSPTGRPIRPVLAVGVIVCLLAILVGLPWWTLMASGVRWPAPAGAVGNVVFGAVFVVLPWLMLRGHGPRGDDRSARIADAMLGAMWVLFSWSLIGTVLRVVLAASGVGQPLRARLVAGVVAGVSAILLAWGHREAMRVPRVRHVTVTMPRLGAGLDGLRVVLLTDTHYGPIERARWSAEVVAAVNTLRPDIVCHTGDIADGPVGRRREQAAPLGAVSASLGRVYVTGNHEYLAHAQEWLDHMRDLGWTPLHNAHLVVERGGDRLVVAGVDDAIAAGTGVHGHGADHAAALAGADPALPVLLLAHQPKQIVAAVRHGVDLQLSGHTHGGQIWPFAYLVRLDQPVVAGLSRHGDRTQLYTSRGTGFWGPPFRIFAPSEITVLTLRSTQVAQAA